LKNKKIPIIILSLLLISTAANAQLKFAFVDSDVIIKQLPEAQEVQKKMEDLQKAYLDTINDRETELKTKAAAFKTKYEDAQKQVQAGTLKPDEITALESEINNMQTELQKLDQSLSEYKQTIQQTLVSTQQELFKPIKEKITKVIGDVAKELKYSLVLDKASDALLYGDKDIDITFKVLDKLK
jgi:outer membrane protein